MLIDFDPMELQSVGSILQHAQSAAAAFRTEIELSTSDLMRHLCHSVFYSPKCVFPTVRSLVSSFSEEPAKRVVQQPKNIIVFFCLEDKPAVVREDSNSVLILEVVRRQQFIGLTETSTLALGVAF